MKILCLVPFAALVLSSTLAVADDNDRRAGTKGHVTAFEPDGVTVIDVDPCARKGATWDYVGCGKPFRAKVSAAICREKGDGRHTWLYQVGDNRTSRMTQTANCK